MLIEKFEDIKAWQKAKDLTARVYKIFQKCKDFSFRDQIQRASISIMNNIAEGFERRTNKELINFMYIAKGSSGEVRSMLYMASILGYITKEEFTTLTGQTIEITKIIAGFIKSINP